MDGRAAGDAGGGLGDEVGVGPLERGGLGERAPAEVRAVGEAEEVTGELLEAAGLVEVRGHLGDEALVPEHSLLGRGGQRSVVGRASVAVAPLKAGELGLDQEVVVEVALGRRLAPLGELGEVGPDPGEGPPSPPSPQLRQLSEGQEGVEEAGLRGRREAGQVVEVLGDPGDRLPRRLVVAEDHQDAGLLQAGLDDRSGVAEAVALAQVGLDVEALADEGLRVVALAPEVVGDLKVELAELGGAALSQRRQGVGHLPQVGLEVDQALGGAEQEVGADVAAVRGELEIADLEAADVAVEEPIGADARVLRPGEDEGAEREEGLRLVGPRHRPLEHLVADGDEPPGAGEIADRPGEDQRVAGVGEAGGRRVAVADRELEHRQGDEDERVRVAAVRR